MPNYKELAVQAIPFFTPSAAERLCHLPFQPTEHCALQKTQIWSPFSSEQMQTRTICWYLLASNIWGIPGSNTAPLLWGMWIFFIFHWKKRNAKPLFYWVIEGLGDWLSCLIDWFIILDHRYLFYNENISIFIWHG